MRILEARRWVVLEQPIVVQMLTQISTTHTIHNLSSKLSALAVMSVSDMAQGRNSTWRISTTWRKAAVQQLGTHWQRKWQRMNIEADTGALRVVWHRVLF